MPNLYKYFFGSLPDYFYHSDSYKDGEDRGFLQRFLQAFQEETEGFILKVDGSPELKLPLVTPPEYLGMLAADYGYPPTIFRIDQKFRDILRVISFIKFRRGTLKAVIEFFYVLGVDIELTLVGPESYTYDDSSYQQTNYDVGLALCRYYKATILDPNGELPMLGEDPVPEWALVNLIKIFEYLLPINAMLQEIEYEGEVILDEPLTLRKFTDSDTDIRISAENLIRKYK